jgi:hypothetical protein
VGASQVKVTTESATLNSTLPGAPMGLYGVPVTDAAAPWMPFALTPRTCTV